MSGTAMTFEQLRDEGKESVAIFEKILCAALRSMLPDLAACPWYVREHEVVNLFVFGHLIPKFYDSNLDIRQIGIEVPTNKHRKSAKEKHGRNGDIVIWPHVGATVWRTCKPLAMIEWKNISCRHQEQASGLRRDHEEDVEFLKRNADLICVGYAVLTSQCNNQVAVHCKRVQQSSAIDLAIEEPRGVKWKQSDLEAVLDPAVRDRPPECPNCKPARHLDSVKVAANVGL